MEFWADYQYILERGVGPPSSDFYSLRTIRRRINFGWDHVPAGTNCYDDAFQTLSSLLTCRWGRERKEKRKKFLRSAVKAPPALLALTVVSLSRYHYGVVNFLMLKGIVLWDKASVHRSADFSGASLAFFLLFRGAFFIIYTRGPESFRYLQTRVTLFMRM